MVPTQGSTEIEIASYVQYQQYVTKTIVVTSQVLYSYLGHRAM
jgi:hypothetical protein